jgi:hypothetical protein
MFAPVCAKPTPASLAGRAGRQVYSIPSAGSTSRSVGLVGSSSNRAGAVRGASPAERGVLAANQVVP